jgi:pentatricopeptide repeat protein
MHALTRMISVQSTQQCSHVTACHVSGVKLTTQADAALHEMAAAAAAAATTTTSAAAGGAPDVVTYGTVLQACAMSGSGERALALFAEMIASGIQPNITAYRVSKLVSYYINSL